jgi:Helix-turn-helix domain
VSAEFNPRLAFDAAKAAFESGEISPPLIYDVATAAELLKQTERWLTDQLRRGRFPARKIGRRWALSKDDLDEIVRLCAVSGPPAPSSAAEAGVPQARSMTRTSARRISRSDK